MGANQDARVPQRAGPRLPDRAARRRGRAARNERLVFDNHGAIENANFTEHDQLQFQHSAFAETARILFSVAANTHIRLLTQEEATTMLGTGQRLTREQQLQSFLFMVIKLGNSHRIQAAVDQEIRGDPLLQEIETRLGDSSHNEPLEIEMTSLNHVGQPDLVPEEDEDPDEDGGNNVDAAGGEAAGDMGGGPVPWYLCGILRVRNFIVWLGRRLAHCLMNAANWIRNPSEAVVQLFSMLGSWLNVRCAQEPKTERRIISVGQQERLYRRMLTCVIITISVLNRNKVRFV